jgi:hypothetical protein
VLPVRAEWTNIAWGLVNKAMTNHFILPLETFAPLTTGTSRHGTVMWSLGRMNIRMRIEQILCLEGRGIASRISTLVSNSLRGGKSTRPISDRCRHRSGRSLCALRIRSKSAVDGCI